jgi:hypothetical protein
MGNRYGYDGRSSCGYGDRDCYDAYTYARARARGSKGKEEEGEKMSVGARWQGVEQ